MTEKKWPETWQDTNPGLMVLKPASSRSYLTGGWRAQKPIYDNTKCIKCGICYLFCPEACITEDAEGFFTADLNYCKGCGICYHECWPRAIKMVED
ncbi:MAG: 4Fe-4S binding protein [Deltaproteobacteria bacterium]|nr:4Fe-4S binding protein [Deltaproteobacteria bacterium]